MPPPSLPVTGVCSPFLTPTGPQLCGQHVRDPGQGKFTPPLLPIPVTLECFGRPTPSHLPQEQCSVPSPCQLGWGGTRSVLLVRQGSFLSHRRSQELRSSRSSGLVVVRKRQMRRERSGPTLRGRPTPPVFTGRSARRARRSCSELQLMYACGGHSDKQGSSWGPSSTATGRGWGTHLLQKAGGGEGSDNGIGHSRADTVELPDLSPPDPPQPCAISCHALAGCPAPSHTEGKGTGVPVLPTWRRMQRRF